MNGMENKMRKLFCLLAGAGTGVLMSAIVLFALIHTGFAAGTAGFLIVMVITSALPWTIETFRKDVFDAAVMEGVAVIVSALIVFAYIMTVTSGDAYAAYYGEMRMTLGWKMGVAHIVSFAFVFLRLYIRSRRSSK